MPSEIKAAIERVRNDLARGDRYHKDSIIALCDFAARHAEPVKADAPELVEVVARRLRSYNHGTPDEACDGCAEEARSILTTLIPPNHVVVPIELLERMFSELPKHRQPYYRSKLTGGMIGN